MATAAAGLAGPAFGQAGPGLPPQPANVVSLSATATMELTMDWLTVVFNTQREGTDAAAVQSQLRQALDTALAEARKAARPGEVLVRTGAFTLHPRYGQKGGISGWQGHAELVIEGRDTPTIAQMMGRIQTLTIGRVGWSLSREAREKVEGEVAAQAIARFRTRADAVARQFGLSGYTIREVSVTGNEPGGPPVVMMRTQAARSGADESLPVEAGKAQVTATVSGTVQMK
ncbi:MAG: SIMPL domain-containing protein [Rubrivivax sp.]|nr:SIMPL domain-containing protein [Rubrivivax sp.]